MAQRNIPCGEAPQVIIQAEENLSIQGVELAEIRIIINDLGDLSVVEDDRGMVITCEEDCAIHLPVGAKVEVREVGGSATIADFPGILEIGQVDGNLFLKDVGDVKCNRIDGNCWLESAGRFSVGTIGGNLKGKATRDTLNASGVGGNIKLESAKSVEGLRAGGNISIKVLEILKDLDLAACGNIRLFLPQKPGFILNAVSGGQNVSVYSEGKLRKFSGSAYGVQFGQGEAKLHLSAGGNITVSDQGLEEKESQGFGLGDDIEIDIDWDSMTDRFKKRIKEKMRKAERKVEAEQRRAEYRVREAMKKVEGFDFSNIINTSLHGAGWPFSATAAADEEPVEEREEVTDAEKMIILNLLQEKKITAEEAERLLDALAGKFD
jgi:hypothetical protein